MYMYLYIYIYTKAFILYLIKIEKEYQKKKWRDGEIGEHKLNEIGTLNMK